MAPFGMFEVTKLGLIYATVVTAYLLTVGRKLLPHRQTLATPIVGGEPREFLTQAVISKMSPLVGKTLPQTPLARLRDLRLIEVRRDGERLTAPLTELEFAEGDQLLLKTAIAGVHGVRATAGIEFRARKEFGLSEVETRRAVLMEGLIGRRSLLIGRTLKELDFRQRYGVLILAVHQQGMDLREDFEDVRLGFGDTLLVEGPSERIGRLMEEGDFVSLTEPTHRPLRTAKAPIAIAAVVLLMALAAFGVLPIAGLALIAAITVVAMRCIDASDAYAAIEWKIIFIILGMLVLGQAMEATGAAALMAHGVTEVFGRFGPVAVLSATYLLASVLTEMISNNAVAVLLTPIALSIAEELGVDGRPFIVALMFGTSASFATPIGYQTNTYVYGAGGYRFADFLRVGAPLNVILWLLASVLIPLFWPLRPVP